MQMNANQQIANMNENQLVFPELSYKLTGILFAAHNELGRYCNEKQYGDLLEKMFQEKSVTYEREKIIPESFMGEKTGRNKIDFIIDDKIVLELKSTRILSREAYYQTRRYLDAYGKKLGILVNFRDKYLKPKRILNSSIN
ncbi:GxxExxY protein [Candidatus Giovannonibacteria bacterium]|nr:GxxExxY protein [Candidatus Giovannonibacteria bacterium]